LSTGLSRKSLRLGSLAVAVVVVGAGTAAAYASHISSPVELGGTLTTSNGSTSISVSGGTAIAPQVCSTAGTCVPANVSDAAWSADGTRAVFVNQNQQIETTSGAVKGYEWWSYQPASGVKRTSPVFDSTGQYIVWSEKASAAAPAVLRYAPAAASGWQETYAWLSDTAYDYTSPDAGPNGVVAYQRNTDSGGTATGTPEVWIANFETDSTPRLLTEGSQPAVTADKVAFVKSDGTHQQIWVQSYDATGVTGTPLQLTTDASDHTNPTFSYDGNSVAYQNADGTVSLVSATGGSATASGLKGTPAYQTRAQDTVYRISGSNRFSTAAHASQAHWNDGAAAGVVLSRSDDFADALGGAALAAAKHGPLLLTPPTSLNATTSAEITRVLGSNTGATVYLLGGTGAISTSVENAVKALGYQTVRLTGTDRYQTSVAIAGAITDNPSLIVAATGKDFPDALAAGAAAGSWTSYGLPGVVVLTNDSSLPAVTKTYIANHNDALLASVGGQASNALGPYPQDQPIWGSTRYQTASYVAQAFFGGTRYAGIATGKDWPDALAGGALMGALGGPLLLTNGTATDLDPNTAWVLSDRSAAISNPLVFGGTGVVSDHQAAQVGDWMSTSYNMAANPTGLPVDPSIGGTSASSAAKSNLAKAKARFAHKLNKLGTSSSRH
jgi:putative cell wall-binding protein